MLGHRVLLKVQLTRVLCPHCGARLQRVSWLEPHARMTRRLAQAAAASCARLPVAHVAELFALHWSTCESWISDACRSCCKPGCRPQAPRAWLWTSSRCSKGTAMPA